ncbi:hypothetical protein [Mycobacteroides abscessus]|uniref:hypothetical protein n=1 Tax=Mycobacteroides abscessus TaxID=36809 RepID=UPI000929044C|nr:hypothetical protein [Mycobacteroides abscessus]SIF24742.1 Uncharacterised protein [Mycobacteroides abscessus subsp. abscessus]SIF38317.1 Uncharacterised protein [Mycobacteroides abscessus subsp. abscessus]SIF84315.1 Uncharacterised protein [Mycobacteroides abscessus subsp. abscessus]
MRDLYAEDLAGPALPEVVEACFARERSWWRPLRGAGLMDEEAARAELARWMEG